VVLEVARMAAVRSYAVLDRADLTELDGVAAAAAQCMDRPSAGVAFLDQQRVWFAGAYGLADRQMKRAGSLCEQAILQSSPLLVRDVASDSRFRDDSEIGVRFFAGVSVLDEDEYRVGAVCVFDETPGDASPAALAELLRLASEASALLAARRHALAQAAYDSGLVQGWLGVRTRSARLRFGDDRPGLLVLGVAPGSPAEQAGVRPTDVLLSIDDHVLWRSADVVSALARRPVDSMARLQILRVGQVLELAVPIAPQRVRPSVLGRHIE
jgi:GAF domain-containing protein